MTETQTAPVSEGAKTETPKQTIAQKVEILNTEKAAKTQELAGMAADAPGRAALETRIQEIDRKVRWYAGRSGESKGAKADRPSKAASKSSRGKGAKPANQAAETAAATTAASES